MLCNIIHIWSWDLNFTNIIKSMICWKRSGHTHYLLLWLLLLLHQHTASLFWMSAIFLALLDPWSWRHQDQKSMAYHSITSQKNLNPKPVRCGNPKSYCCMVSSRHTICPLFSAHDVTVKHCLKLIVLQIATCHLVWILYNKSNYDLINEKLSLYVINIRHWNDSIFMKITSTPQN